jgi:hypothetical protein
MPVGFLQDPLGIDSDDDAYLRELYGLEPDPFAGPDSKVEIALGPDNPYFDFRESGAPGGVGYYRMHAQYQLVQTGRTCCCLGFQGVTPAGLDNDGLGEGQTVVSPTVAWYHELDGGSAVHGFVGKDFHAAPGWSDNLERCIRYGMAFQSPLCADTETCQSLHMFVEAIGRYHQDVQSLDREVARWEILPGLHWRAGDSWWITGGVILPVGTPHVDTGLWQVTCSCRF